MTATVTTTAAATQAGVTVDTIRTWCRRNIIDAVKQAGRWVIDTVSLNHRIAIGARRARKQTAMTEPTFLITSKTTRVQGHLGVGGLRAALHHAYQTGQPITLSGSFAGERVYLGHTRRIHGDAGITVETIACDRELTVRSEQHAIYLIDFTRLDEAPKLAELIRKEAARTAATAHAMEQRAAAEEARYLAEPEF